jgi:hypothetical protein
MNLRRNYLKEVGSKRVKSCMGFSHHDGASKDTVGVSSGAGAGADRI